MDLVDVIYDLYEPLPFQRAAELKGQSIRAAISIPSNIAEGSSRRSEKDQYRFMEIALGSAFEIETQTITLSRRPWAPKEKIPMILDMISKQQGMLMNFMSRLNA
jgi:four helix bundle protein